MNFRNISSWCIQHPVPPIVLFVGLLLAGVVAFMRMDVTNNPDIDFPAAIVSVSQPGAAPAEMENQITQRVESAIRGVDGVDEINSSVREGYSETFVQFRIGTPTDRAVTDVRDAVAQIRSDLPEGILEPQVQRANIGGGEITFIAAETTDMSLEQLSWYVDNTVARRLLGQRGRRRSDPRRRRRPPDPRHPRSGGAAGPRHHRRAGQRSSFARPISTPPAAAPKSPVPNNRCGCSAMPQPLTICRSTQIAVPGGRVVRLADLGEVQDSYAETRSAAVLGDRQVVSFNVSARQGRIRPRRLRRRLEGAAQDREGRSADQVRRDRHQRRIYGESQYDIFDARADRRRDPRGVRRLPVPARPARDADLGRRHPALGDPDLLVHGLDGHQPQFPVAAGAGAGGRRAGRRRDRRDREYRPPHADGQKRLSGVDSMPPTRSASPCWRRPWRSSRCSCRSR